MKGIWAWYNPIFLTLIYVNQELNEHYLDSSEINVSDLDTEQPGSQLIWKYEILQEIVQSAWEDALSGLQQSLKNEAD